MRFARNLQRLMEEQGLSTYSLAKEVGVTKKAVAGWLTGAEPRAATYKAIADYFGVTVAQLKEGASPTNTIEQKEKSPGMEAEGVSDIKKQVYEKIPSIDDETAGLLLQIIKKTEGK